MCTNDKTKISKEEVESIIKSKIPSYENSVLNSIKFVEGEKVVDYALTKLYKMCNKFQFGLVERVDTGEEFLLTLDSIKKMCIYGYINNIYINTNPTSGKDTIELHTNKLRAGKASREYEVETYSAKDGDNIVRVINDLSRKYDCLYIVDNTDIKSISWLRLVPYGFIFDLGGHICAVKVKDEVGNKSTIEISKFSEMSTQKYNSGKFSPRSGHKNFHRVLDYIDILVDDYNVIKETYGISALRNFSLHECGRYYRGHVQDLTLTLTSQIIDINNSPYELELAIPKPERFNTKSQFESALREARAISETRFNSNNYEIINAFGVDTAVVMNLLLNEYTELHNGKYYNDYSNIADYVIKKYKKFKDIDDEIITNKIIGIIKAYNNGDNIDYDLEMLGILVPDENTGNRHMRLASIHEAAELFGVESLINNQCNSENTETETKHIEDESNKQDKDTVEFEDKAIIKEDKPTEEVEAVKETEKTACNEVETSTDKAYDIIDMVLLTDDSKNRLEVRKEKESIYAYIIINGDEGKIAGSEQSHRDYLFNGLKVDEIEKTLHRDLAVLKQPLTVQDIFNKLK